jgi:hypothetical protein
VALKPLGRMRLQDRAGELGKDAQAPVHRHGDVSQISCATCRCHFGKSPHPT